MIVEQRLGRKRDGIPDHDTATGPHRERALFKPNPKLKLRDQVREVMRFFLYSPRTEETYWHWIERYLRFHKKPALRRQEVRVEKNKSDAVERVPTRDWRHPREMGGAEVREYLSHWPWKGMCPPRPRTKL